MFLHLAMISEIAAQLPRFSIVITTFNRPDYLRAAIDSALGQTYPNVEVLVVDDGSNADNRRRAKELVAKYNNPRLRYFHKENGGPSSARNRGIAESQGEFLKFLDDDDTLELDAAWHYLFALTTTGADMAIGSRRYMSPEGVKWSINYCPDTGEIHRPLKMFFRLKIRPQQGLWCFRRSVFANLQWDETLRAREDTDLLGRALAHGARVAGAPLATLNQRYHSGPRTSATQFKAHIYEQSFRANQRLLEVLKQSDQLKDCGADFAASLVRTALRLWPINRQLSLDTYQLAEQAHSAPSLTIDHVASRYRSLARRIWKILGFRGTARLYQFYSSVSRLVKK